MLSEIFYWQKGMLIQMFCGIIVFSSVSTRIYVSMNYSQF